MDQLAVYGVLGYYLWPASDKGDSVPALPEVAFDPTPTAHRVVAVRADILIGLPLGAIVRGEDDHGVLEQVATGQGLDNLPEQSYRQLLLNF